MEQSQYLAHKKDKSELMNFLERDERRALKFENKLNSYERPSFDNEAHYKKMLEEKQLETS